MDIWSLGCILYRMITGSPLFNSRRDVWRYADREPSPPSVVKNKGFSVACEDFLCEALRPSPEDRPSAEDCLKTGWIMSGDLGSGGGIGLDIYGRLSKIRLEAPDIDSFSHTVTLVREPPAWGLNHKIGTGAFGTVFLEKVQIRGVESPELWAVKRISRALPNFPLKQSQAEIKNFQTLSNVSFVRTCLLSQ